MVISSFCKVFKDKEAETSKEFYVVKAISVKFIFFIVKEPSINYGSCYEAFTYDFTSEDASMMKPFKNVLLKKLLFVNVKDRDLKSDI